MKITITIEDDGDTGAKVGFQFEPEIDMKSETPMTPAAALALRIMEHIPTLAKTGD